MTNEPKELVVRIEDSRKLFPRKTIKLRPGLTVLVGCNGMGKTTTIDELCSKLEERDNIVLSYYCNTRDGGYRGVDNMMYRGKTLEAINASMVSEGEQIKTFLCDFIKNLGSLHVKNPGKTKVVLFDGIDSGYSIDQILEIKKFLHEMIVFNTDPVYIVVSANTFEFARGERCLYVGTLKYMNKEFTDYEQYKKFVLSSRKKKLDRYNKKNRKES